MVLKHHWVRTSGVFSPPPLSPLPPGEGRQQLMSDTLSRKSETAGSFIVPYDATNPQAVQILSSSVGFETEMGRFLCRMRRA